MKANSKFREEEKAVSPVIGVILMAAVTIILAAVISAFVFGMGGTLRKKYMVAATGMQAGTDIIVTYQGGPDHDEVEYFIISQAGSNVSDIPDSTHWPSAGYTKTFKNSGTGGYSDPVVAGVRFRDGTEKVILNTVV